MRYTYFIVTLCCLLISPSAKAQYDYLLHKTHAQRLKYLYEFYRDTLRTGDSAFIFNRINTFSKLAKDNDDDDLLMDTKLMRANYFYYHVARLPYMQVFSVIEQVKQESIKKKKLWSQVLAENMEALIYFDNVHNYELGFEHYQKVYELIKGLDPADFPHKQNCLYQIADKYYSFGNYHESIFYNLEALDAEPPFILHPYPFRLNIANTIGLAYQKLGMLDSSDYYFRLTYADAAKLNMPAWLGISSGNMGYNLFLRKEFDKAIPLLQKDVDVAVANADWGLAAGSLMVLAEINLERGNVAAASEQIHTARQYVYSSGQYSRLQQLYPLLSKLYAAQGQPSLSATFLDSAIFVKDSMVRGFNSLQILRATQQVALERFRSEMKMVDSSKKLYRLQRNVLVTLIILLMIGAVYYYKLQQKKYALKQEQVKKAEKDLDEATWQLHDFAKHISEKNALIEMLEQQSDKENNNVLQQLHQSTILTDDDWDHFRNLFEKAHAGFFNRLKEKLPGLTPAETRFVALSKLGLSNKEMAGILGVGTDAIRQYRSRLRKKLDLGEENNLDELIMNI